MLSDSGGIQEEAPALGVPLLVLRDKTERPEGIEEGNAILVGTSADRIVAAATLLLDDPIARAGMTRRSFPMAMEVGGAHRDDHRGLAEGRARARNTCERVVKSSGRRR